MTVSDVAARLLAYANHEVTDDKLPTGATQYLADAIGGAVSEMVRRAPGLFSKPVGGRLSAKASVSVTVDGTDCTQLSVATAGIVRPMCTLRLGQVNDFTVTGYTHPTATISPGYQGTLGSTVTATAYHDAFSIGAQLRANDETSVSVNGKDLDRVGSLLEAKKVEGPAVDELGVEAGSMGTDAPNYWWIEHDLAGGTYIRVYPLPVAVSAIEVRGAVLITELNHEDIPVSTETFNIDEDVARDVWVPFAKKRWKSSPLFRSPEAAGEIDQQYLDAIDALARLSPKLPRIPDWNHRRRYPNLMRRK